MSRSTRRVLVVDDQREMATLLADQLRDAGFEVAVAFGGAQALAMAADQQPDVAITDLRMANVDGFDVLTGLHALDPDMPVLIMTAFGAVDAAVEAMKRGAFHFLTKPFRLDEMLVQVEKAVETRDLRDQNRVLRRTVARAGLGEMIGASQPMREVYARIERLAPSNVPVLVRGETGTGKERVARALHERSPRRDRAFVAINCASLPAHLLESELFGHVKGSFTGATGPRRGLFVQADGGTLFLDEIGDMPLELQPHLLRVLEDGVIRPVGSDTTRPVDVRIVAATHQSLEERITAGKFRADLFYRLEVVPIQLPPLRNRVEDIPALVESFLARAEGGGGLRSLSPEATQLLQRHAWPGNVRELENLIRRMRLLIDGPEASLEQLLEVAPHLERPKASGERVWKEILTLREVQDDYISWAVQQCGGNKTRAAELLGIDVSTIHRRERR